MRNAIGWNLLAFLLGATSGCFDERVDPAGGSSPDASDSSPSTDRPGPGSGPGRPPGGDTQRIDAGDEDSGIVLECERGPVSALHVEFECGSITVYTCKDLSNVVIEYEDGSRQRFEGLNGHVNRFSGTGTHAGKRIVRVWVKAGANLSGDGPGYGQRVETTVDEDCDAPEAGSGGGGGAAGGCNEGPDVPCVPIPTAGVGGGAGQGGGGGAGEGSDEGPE